ncbi:glycosyltransferase [Pseudochelatococcus sp. G4_1912]|uniref:glycosyltransferase n=1 Tax=Pseudochelatococcus sp. G4_1912 TaxID=3114288 RepID=UPI0039C68E73
MVCVSVVMPSYNHARFIAQAIKSVLHQSMGDIELIVVDDQSQDNSNAIIASIDDPRLRHIRLSKNVGACAAMNIAISHCTGEYIAICNSDDIWERHKLERQLAVIKTMPEVGAIFSDVSWINDNGKELKGAALPHFSTVFAQPNRSRYGWIRHLIETGNCLCHPSALIRRTVFETLGAYNNMLRQLPDLDMWLRVVQAYEIHVMRDRLVRFRIHANNTSQPNDINTLRTWREHTLIANSFFDEVSQDNFYHAMGIADFVSFHDEHPATFTREKVAYLTRSSCTFRKLFLKIGIDMAYRCSLKYKAPILSALEFHALTASQALIEAQPLITTRPLGRRLLRHIIGPVMYERLRALRLHANKNLLPLL